MRSAFNVTLAIYARCRPISGYTNNPALPAPGCLTIEEYFIHGIRALALARRMGIPDGDAAGMADSVL
ncbi:MAG: hypothetical protein Tsb002_00120 [Wenzhouxiangellaceae bacterium]